MGQGLLPAALKAFETKGKNYGVPINLDAKYLAYSKAAFTKAGIGAAPSSLEDLLSACDKLKSAGYTPIAFGNQYGWPAIHYITQLNAYNVAPETLAKDYNPATGEFTDAGYTKAVDQFKDIVTRCSSKDANGVSHEAGQANFLNGEGRHALPRVGRVPGVDRQGWRAEGPRGQLGLHAAAGSAGRGR